MQSVPGEWRRLPPNPHIHDQAVVGPSAASWDPQPTPGRRHSRLMKIQNTSLARRQAPALCWLPVRTAGRECGRRATRVGNHLSLPPTGCVWVLTRETRFTQRKKGLSTKTSLPTGWLATVRVMSDCSSLGHLGSFGCVLACRHFYVSFMDVVCFEDDVVLCGMRLSVVH